jgi:predicted dehydrogenase
MGMKASQMKVAALIGAGMVAKTHVSACADSAENMRLKGIMSRSNERARILAVDASSITGEEVSVYESVADIAADSEIDFVVIATPPNVRAELIAPLAAAGKHILLEKPIGRTAEESREIVKICQDAGVTLGIVFQHRVRDASTKAKAIVEDGKLGQLGLAELNVPWWREQAYYDEPGRGTYARDGGGVLISQAIHTIDLGLSLTGPVSSVTAMAKTTKFHEMESEDYVVAGLEFANGAVGSMVASTASFPGGAESITLHFEAASLHLEAGVLTITSRDGKVENFGEEAGTGGGADPMAFSHEWHQKIIENFVLTLNGRAELFVSGQEALLAHELIDATVRAASSGTKQNVGL